MAPSSAFRIAPCRLLDHGQGPGVCGESVATATSPVVPMPSSKSPLVSHRQPVPSLPVRSNPRSPALGQRNRNGSGQEEEANGPNGISRQKKKKNNKRRRGRRFRPEFNSASFRFRNSPHTVASSTGNSKGRRRQRTPSAQVRVDADFKVVVVHLFVFFCLLFRLSRTDDGAESRPRRRRRRRRVKPRRPATSTTDAMAVAVVVATPHLRRRRLVLLASLFVLLAATPSSLPSASGRSIHSQCSILMNEPSFISFLSFYLV